MLGRFLHHVVHGVAALSGTFVNVPASGLYSAIVNAVPGTVITEVGGPGAPIALNFTNLNIADPGIAVVLDPAQVVTLKTTGVTGGMAFYSGVFQRDQPGDETSHSNYAVQLTPGANRIAFRGNRFGQSWLHVTGNQVTDLDFDSIDFRDTRSDVFQIIDVQRLRINNVYGSTVLNYIKFCYYDDGTAPPPGNIAQRDCENPTSGSAGHWIDTSHGDFLQARGAVWVTGDYTITNNTVLFSDSGFDDYGAASVGNPGQMTQRVRIWDNSITMGGKPVYFRGTDFDLRRNTTARYPGVDYFKINYYLAPDAAASAAGGHRVQGYGNTGDVFSVTGEVGSVDLAAATLNGSPGVVAPELPRIQFPAWFPPVPSRPTPLPVTATARPVDQYSLKWTGTPTAGVWFTIYPGDWRDNDQVSYEYRFKLNGAIVSTGAQVFQAPAGSVGAVLTGEARATTAIGTSAWFAAPAVTLQ